MAVALGERIEMIYQQVNARNPGEEEFHQAVNYVVGANIAGFMKVAKSMVALGLI